MARTHVFRSVSPTYCAHRGSGLCLPCHPLGLGLKLPAPAPLPITAQGLDATGSQSLHFLVPKGGGTCMARPCQTHGRAHATREAGPKPWEVAVALPPPQVAPRAEVCALPRGDCHGEAAGASASS